MKKTFLVVLAACLFISGNIKAQYQWVSQVSGTSAFLTSVCFISSDTGYVSSETGQIIKTLNGGQNWSILSAEGPWSSLVFLDYLHGFGVGEGCILNTANGASSWDTAYKNPNVFAPTKICFPTRKYGYASAYDINMGSYVLKSVNSGTTWDTIYHNTNEFFDIVYFKDSLNGFVGGSFHSIYKTSDGGNTWDPILVDPINTVTPTSINFPTPDTGFISTDLYIYRTIDGGDSWTLITDLIPAGIYSVLFTNANNGYAVGGNGINSMTLYQTHNGGNTWTQSASGIQTMSSVFFTDSITGYTVGTNGTILKHVVASGIGENYNANNSISIYPNPATDKINIGLSDNVDLQNSQISVYSLQGQLLMQKELNKEASEINVSGLVSGVYFIKVFNGSTLTVTKLLKE